MATTYSNRNVGSVIELQSLICLGQYIRCYFPYTFILQSWKIEKFVLLYNVATGI